MKISDKFIVSSIADENIILPIDNDLVDYNSIFILNNSGMFIISCFPASEEEIIDRMTSEYDLTREDAKTHLDTFLREVKKYGIVEE